MRIKVIFTGGTIGSKKSKNGINIDKDTNAQRLLIENFYKDDLNTDVIFDTEEPFSILSENMSISYWNILIKCLKNIDFEKYNGVIIAHGTDTLSYTTNLLSLLLSGINIPVVMVSSDYVLTDIRSNGNDNFKNAVYFIKHSNLKGVYAVYRDYANVHRLFLGSRLKQCSCLSNEYSSTANINFGEIKNNEILLYDIPQNPSKNNILSNKKSMLLDKIDCIKPCVAQIFSYTGLNYDMYYFPNNIKAVVNFLYHGGTTCIENKEQYCTSIIEFLKQEKNKHIDFFVSPIEKSRSEIYESTSLLISENIKLLYDISNEMAYIKLLIAYSTDDINIRKYILDTNIFFEEIKDYSDFK